MWVYDEIKKIINQSNRTFSGVFLLIDGKMFGVKLHHKKLKKNGSRIFQ